MELTVIAVQLFIAAAMIDVWILRYNVPLRARGGNAQTMREEFRLYGLPDWFRDVTRVLKLGCAAGMFAGVWFSSAAFWSASLLLILMTGAVVMHLKVSDPIYKSIPAGFFLLLSLGVAFIQSDALPAF